MHNFSINPVRRLFLRLTDEKILHNFIHSYHFPSCLYEALSQLLPQSEYNKLVKKITQLSLVSHLASMLLSAILLVPELDGCHSYYK